MNAAPSAARRVACLRALEVEPLRLRAVHAATPDAVPLAAAGQPPVLAHDVAAHTGIRRLALQPDPAELAVPVLHQMYTALTDAISRVGLQLVRVCDVADDASAAVMVFGAAPVPDDIPLVRVLRVDPLAVLRDDRARKRLLWEQLQALGRAAGSA